MWELDHKEGWALKNWCFWTVVLEKTPESPLDCKKVKPVNPKGNPTWIFIGRTDAKAAILWPLDVKSQLIGKDLDAGKDWRQEDKGMAEDEMAWWHHLLNGHEFEHTLGDGEGQGSLTFFSHGVPQSRKWLSNWTTQTTVLYTVLYSKVHKRTTHRGCTHVTCATELAYVIGCGNTRSHIWNFTTWRFISRRLTTGFISLENPNTTAALKSHSQNLTTQLLGTSVEGGGKWSGSCFLYLAMKKIKHHCVSNSVSKWRYPRLLA